MRKWCALLLTFLLSQCTHTPQLSNNFQPDLVQQRESTTRNDQPHSHPIIERIGYTLAYDGRLRNPAWVYEELTQASLEGDVDRSHFEFMEDPLLPPSMRSTLADYKNSGFDRGHLRPAAHAHMSEEAMKETFYLSNISPQHPLLNRKYWLKLEKHVRELTKTADKVTVITGPLFLPTEESDGKRYVKYQVIGKNDVAVPTHYFKVIRYNSKVEAYIIPNEAVLMETPLNNFSVTVERVEKAAGISLYSDRSKRVKNAEEAP